MVYSSGSAVRDDVSGPGTWAFLPARLPDGETVAVNAGFVQNTMQDRAQQDRAVARLVTGKPVTLTGYIRFPEPAGVLTPAENHTKRLWFTRDHLAMAHARLGWGGKSGAVLHRPGNRRCLRAAFRNRARSRSISRTITCNTPSPGSRWRALW